MRKVYARNCTISTISDDIADEFVRENHKMGIYSASKMRKNLGLFNGPDLLGVAIFDIPRTQAKQRAYTSELYRLAFKKGVRVPGGASKLIKAFIKNNEPISLFTYQSTGGENTDVYEKSGMKLVEKAKNKKILVADDPTAERQEISLQQALQWGPDRLIGTKLGEVIEYGKRVSNIELFLRNGYHFEEIPGDNVYEWINPNTTHYIYKITSTADNGYYIGRHSVRKKLTADECLIDGYLGSGGEKYKNWVAKVGEKTLNKEILKICSTRLELIKAEEKAIGDLYNTPECKNTQPGGIGAAAYGYPKTVQKLCEKGHGITSHVGKSCKKCIAESFNKTKFCPNGHGMTGHKGDSCNKCASERALSTRFCLACQKETTHLGSNCATCNSQGSISLRFCEACQRETKHQGDSCSTCSSAKINVQKVCERGHGLTWHKGDSCNKCAAESAQSKKYCEACEKKTNHIGDHCTSCLTNSGLVLKYCETCGKETKHRSKTGACISCSIKDLNSKQLCPNGHGLTWFKGGSCSKCASEKAFTTENCSRGHGMVQHQSGRCCTCIAEEVNKVKECQKHGEAKHIGDRCRQCIADEKAATYMADKLAKLAAVGYTEEFIVEAFKTTSQCKLVEVINKRAGENLVSRPYLKKILQHLGAF